MKNANDVTNGYGFYSAYFELLQLYKTSEDAFNFLNYEVKRITGKKPFKCYCEFKKLIYDNSKE